MKDLDIRERIEKFIQDRNWDQFHSPENLSKSIVIEAAELLENFQWDGRFNLDKVKDELADVLIYCYQLSIALDVDVNEIMHNKMDKNQQKYPIEKAKNNSKKYTEFE